MPSNSPHKRLRNRGFRTAIALLVLVFAPGLTAQELTFVRSTIDADNPSNPHNKTLGDIDGDGLIDALAASSSGDGMFWYEYPSWTKHTIRASGSWTTDMQVGDFDADGDLDIVIPNSSGLQWYENPRPGGDPRTDNWTEHLIGTGGANHHDVEIGDVDADGDLDVVSRRKGGNPTTFWRQSDPLTWQAVTVSTSGGEGTALGDLDGDGDLDVAHNGFWVEQVDPTTWTEHTFDADWPDDDVGVLIVDLDGNGLEDIVIGPSESADGRLSWYETTDPVDGPWTEHSIDPTVSYLHTFKAVDMDLDGDLDLVTAEMHQSSDPDEVSVYVNAGAATNWDQVVVATSGSHNLRVGDIGNDGDLDIFGANWNDGAPNSAVIEFWENQTPPLTLGFWERHIIETDLPWRAVFVDGKDLNGDSLPDLVTGGWWYPNPGALGGTWTRQTIGGSLHNLAVAHDFDRDGDLDLLGTDGQHSGDGFSWARNDGTGSFTHFDITHTASGGDFLQGVSVGPLTGGGGDEVVLSWHNGAAGTSAFTVPSDPTTAAWPLATLSATTNQEQIPLGDLDGDGDLDIHLGDQWLRQESDGSFTTLSGMTVTGGDPDRVVLGDIDRDGNLDVVVGVEFGNRLVWGENSSNGATWTERLIATDFDYFSVDVGDVDRDGDLDVVGGAHQGDGEVTLYENDGTGGTWTAHPIDTGDSSAIDHHDGTRLVDMDLDGDLDVISIGWTLQSLVLYENLALGGGLDLTPPEIVSVTANSDPQSVTVTFSEPLESTSAEDPGHYTISDGVVVSAATLDGSGTVVQLTTSTLSQNTIYTLTVDGVADVAGNTIAPHTQVPFLFVSGPSAEGLVLHWPFDEGIGTIALDVSGNGLNGTLVNQPTWTSEPSLAFDGADDHVTAGGVDFTGSAITVAAWVWADDLANCTSRDCRILSKATGTSEDAHYLMLSSIEGGGSTRLRFRLKTDGATSTLIATSGDLPENEWFHAAAVYDGAEMRLYLDGSLVGSAGKTGALSTNDTIPLWVGGNPPSASERPWDGKIDDVRIYDRALTVEELQVLPPPSAFQLFDDGFESGDASAWSASVGS